MSERTQSNPSREDGIRKVEKWLRQDRATDPVTELQEAMEMRQAVVQELASRLTPAMNQMMHVGGMESYEAKRVAAKAATKLAQGFGLCFKCPRSGEPVVLMGSSRDDARGRFQFFSCARGIGRKRDRTLSAVELPTLQLIPEPTDSLRQALKFLRDNFTSRLSTQCHLDNRSRG